MARVRSTDGQLEIPSTVITPRSIESSDAKRTVLLEVDCFRLKFSRCPQTKWPQTNQPNVGEEDVVSAGGTAGPLPDDARRCAHWHWLLLGSYRRPSVTQFFFSPSPFASFNVFRPLYVSISFLSFFSDGNCKLALPVREQIHSRDYICLLSCGQ